MAGMWASACEVAGGRIMYTLNFPQFQEMIFERRKEIKPAADMEDAMTRPFVLFEYHV